MMRARLVWSAMAVVLLLAGPVTAGQNTVVKSSEAITFIGTWVFTMTNPTGSHQTVRIGDKNGIVAASLQIEQFPPNDVTGIIKDGHLLVLTTTLLENGRPIWAVISLTLDDHTMNMAQMLEFSQTIKRGTGKKQ